MHGRVRYIHESLDGKPQEKRSLGKYKRTGEDNVEANLK